MSATSKTAKLTIIYAAGILLSKAVSILMLPIYTRFLTPGDYGTIELVTLTVDILGCLASLGFCTAIFKFYYLYTDREARDKAISTIICLAFIFYLTAGTLGFVFSQELADLVLDGGPTNKYYFQIMSICLFLQVFIDLPMAYIRAEQRAYVFIMLNGIKLLIQLSLNIYFVVILKLTVLGVLYSTLISLTLFGVILVIYILKRITISFSTQEAKAVLIFGLPFLLANIGDFFLTYSDRYFLKIYTDINTIGIYALGYKLGFVLWMFPVSPFMSIWDSQRFQLADNKEYKQINKKVFLYFNSILILCALGMSLFSFDFFRIMSAPEFWSAHKIVPIIMIAYIIQSWTVFGSFGVLYKTKTKHIGYGTIIAAASMVLFNYILIPRFQAYGAAIATVMAFSIRFIYIYLQSQQYYRLCLPWKKVISVLGIASMMVFVSFLIQHDQLVISLSQDILLLFCFFLLLSILPIFSTGEKQFLTGLLRHPIAYYRTIQPAGND